MKKTVLLLLATLTMACIVTGCEEEEGFPEEVAWGYYISLSGDKLVCTKDGPSIKYSPRDIKDIPDFLYTEEAEEAAETDFFSWHGFYIWTGILDGKRYYAYNYLDLSSQIYGFFYTENGEHSETDGFEDNWTDIEVIYIHPKYIEYCKENKEPIRLRVPKQDN